MYSYMYLSCVKIGLNGGEGLKYRCGKYESEFEIRSGLVRCPKCGEDSNIEIARRVKGF